jgi:hypothetical protein
MSTLADVFRELNTLKADDLVRDYAIGGATAALFYAEPARTYDIDVFVVLGGTAPASLVSLERFYEWARMGQRAGRIRGDDGAHARLRWCAGAGDRS